MQKTYQRKKKLLNMLLFTETISVDEASQKLGISAPTTRRLFNQLANEGQVMRIRGGIRHIMNSKGAYSFDSLKNEHVEEKVRIAKYACKLVQSNQVIFIEAGTTLQHFSIALADRIRNQELTNIVIFTNSLINLEILHPVQRNLQMIGGQYRDERKDFVGFLSELSLKGLRFNHCFIGADAVSLSGGVMAMDMDTVHFDSELVKHAEKTVILAHSEKFRRSSLISYIAVDQVDSIITDSGLEQSIADEYRARNINLIMV